MTQRTKLFLNLLDDTVYSLVGLIILTHWIVSPIGRGDPWWVGLHLAIALFVGRSIARLWIYANNKNEYLKINGVSHD